MKRTNELTILENSNYQIKYNTKEDEYYLIEDAKSSLKVYVFLEEGGLND